MEKPFPAYEGEEPYVFVCYAHLDAAAVYPDIAWLRDQGINIWYDEGISAGAIWRQKLAEAIEGAAKFLYFISSDSLKSDHCNREIYYAVDKGIEIVPVYLEEAQLTPELALTLARVHALHRHVDPDYQRHILGALKGNQSVSRAGHQRPLTVPTSSRRGPVVAFAIAILLLVVMVGWFASRERPPLATATADAGADALPTVQVRRFTVLDDSSDLKRYTTVTTEDIKKALTTHERLSLLGTSAPGTPDFIVSGGIRAIDQGVRVSVDLQRSSDGLVIWTETLDDLREVSKSFEFPRAPYVAYSVNSMVINAQYRAFLEQMGATKNPQALNAFFAGITENRAARVGDGNYAVAIDHLRRAIALDPGFSEPRAMLALIYAIRAQGAIGLVEARTKAHEQVVKLANLKETPLVYYALAYVNLRLEMNYDQALHYITKAEATSMYQSYQMQLVKCQIDFAQGNLTEAIPQCRGAAATGGSLEWYVLGNILNLAGRHQDAVDAFEKSLQISDTSEARDKEQGVHDNLGYQLLDMMSRSQFLKGDVNGANATLDSVSARQFDRFPRKYAASLALLGRKDEALAALALMDKSERSGEPVEPVARFWPYFYLNDVDRAFDELNRAIEARDIFLIGALRASPDLDSLRDDPRFAAAIARIQEIEMQSALEPVTLE